MAKLRRFYYVGTLRSSGLIHRCEGRVEGDLTFCGRVVRKGWVWWLGARRGEAAKRELCEKCL